MQNRFLSPVTWAAVAAQIVSLLIVLNIIDVGLGDKLNAAVVALLELLTAFGVLNNPTDSKRF